MAKQRRIDIQFPIAGLNRRGAYRQQAPYTTPDCLNMRSTGCMDGRQRGGSRPGLMVSHTDNLGGSVRMLSLVTLALGDGFTAWSDTFSGSAMADNWTQAPWASALPSILTSALASVDDTIIEGEAVLDVLSIDTSKSYTVEAFLTPWGGEWHGKYRLYLRLDDTLPDYETDGIMIELIQTGSTGSYTGTLTSVKDEVSTVYTIPGGSIGSVKPGWLSASVDGDSISVYWNGVALITQTVDAHFGTRAGFGMECTVSGGVCLMNVFRVQYYSIISVPSLRSMIIASAGGDLYYESTYGRMTKITSNLTLRDDVQLFSVQDGQELIIADYGEAVFGTDGSVNGTALSATGISDWTAENILPYDMVAVISNVTGTAVAGTYKISTTTTSSVTLTSSAGVGNCAYRIERAPKVFNPADGTTEILTASTGQVPTGCPLVCRFLDRIVLAGAEIAPHVWYASRYGDSTDWDYSQEDTGAAVAGPGSEAGVPGDPITALIPFTDDYLIIGCRNSLWKMTGDPANGGFLVSVSRNIGVIGPKAWCFGPSCELCFLSLDGIYTLLPNTSDTTSYPIPASRASLPHEFLNLNPGIVLTSLEYDIQARGVHIFLTSESSNTRLHWFMDWDNKTLWPLSLDSDHEPTSVCVNRATAIEESGVILGCRDGYLRKFNDLAETDCGVPFSTYIIIGPIGLAIDSFCGTIFSMDANMAENSGNVTWELISALTFEDTITATPSSSGTWNSGINSTVYPACRGQACTLKLTGTSGRNWEVENISAIIKAAGKRRIT